MMNDRHTLEILLSLSFLQTLDYKAMYNSMRKPASFFDGRLVAPHRELKEIGFRVEALGVKI